jgi:hypothetical protein
LALPLKAEMEFITQPFSDINGRKNIIIRFCWVKRKQFLFNIGNAMFPFSATPNKSHCQECCVAQRNPFPFADTGIETASHFLTAFFRHSTQ